MLKLRKKRRDRSKIVKLKKEEELQGSEVFAQEIAAPEPKELDARDAPVELDMKDPVELPGSDGPLGPGRPNKLESYG